MEPHQHDDDSETWAVHRPSQPEDGALTQSQVNGAVGCIFVVSLCLNYVLGVVSGGSGGSVGGLLVLYVLLALLASWVFMIFKIKEASVWPEELRFCRDSTLRLAIGCGSKVLDCNSHGGVVCMRRPLNSWGCAPDTLGIWCNAITDRSREEVFVLLPARGPQFWRGFAFQPEDTANFLYDLEHAGVTVLEENEFGLLMMEEGGNSNRTRLLAREFDGEDDHVSGAEVSDNFACFDRNFENLHITSVNRRKPSQSHEDDGVHSDTSSEESESRRHSADNMKNNNIIEV